MTTYLCADQKLQGSENQTMESDGAVFFGRGVFPRCSNQFSETYVMLYGAFHNVLRDYEHL
jgi:hypothetical protein